jgi:hypothetical protein
MWVGPGLLLMSGLSCWLVPVTAHTLCPLPASLNLPHCAKTPRPCSPPCPDLPLVTSSFPLLTPRTPSPELHQLPPPSPLTPHPTTQVPRLH